MLKRLNFQGGVGFFALVAGLVILGTAGLVFAETGAPAPTAPGVPGAPGAPQPPGLMGMLMPFLLMFGVVYFLMIRPQQKRAKDQQKMLSALKKGDEVVTSSGFLGKIHGITEKVITLELNDNVRVKILKSQVSQVVDGQVKDLPATP